MNSQNLDASALDATVIGSLPSQESFQTGSASGPAPRVALISGTAPRLESETQELLRIRLRAAAIVLLAGVASFKERLGAGGMGEVYLAEHRRKLLSAKQTNELKALVDELTLTLNGYLRSLTPPKS
jgi:hypothetical protein